MLIATKNIAGGPLSCACWTFLTDRRMLEAAGLVCPHDHSGFRRRGHMVWNMGETDTNFVLLNRRGMEAMLLYVAYSACRLADFLHD